MHLSNLKEKILAFSALLLAIMEGIYQNYYESMNRLGKVITNKAAP